LKGKKWVRSAIKEESRKNVISWLAGRNECKVVRGSSTDGSREKRGKGKRKRQNLSAIEPNICQMFRIAQTPFVRDRIDNLRIYL
jgi:hypothetical protein